MSEFYRQEWPSWMKYNPDPFNQGQPDIPGAPPAGGGGAGGGGTTPPPATPVPGAGGTPGFPPAFGGTRGNPIFNTDAWRRAIDQYRAQRQDWISVLREQLRSDPRSFNVGEFVAGRSSFPDPREYMKG